MKLKTSVSQHDRRHITCLRSLIHEIFNLIRSQRLLMDKRRVRLREKPDCLFNQSIHIRLPIESNCLLSIFLELVFQSVVLKSSQESQVGVTPSVSPLNATVPTLVDSIQSPLSPHPHLRQIPLEA